MMGLIIATFKRVYTRAGGKYTIKQLLYEWGMLLYDRDDYEYE